MTVVVCDHKHVMLADFYGGVCPTCRSTATVAFSRDSVEYAKRLKARSGTAGAALPGIVRALNTALGWTLGLLAAALIVLFAAGLVSNTRLMLRGEALVIPRTGRIISRSAGFFYSEAVAEKFRGSVSVIASRSGDVLVNAANVLTALGEGLWKAVLRLWPSSDTAL